MNRIGMNIVMGTLWILVAIWMFTSGNGNPENQASAAILIILGLMFYWAAFKMFQNPNLIKKNKKNMIQQITDPNYKSKIINTKKKK